MTKKKTTGAYYTPSYLSDFIFSRLEENLKDRNRLSLLEPSVGDGSFLDALLRANISNKKNITVKAIEINKSEIAKLKKRNFRKMLVNFIHKDFLRFEPSVRKKYDIIIGNPPYVKKNILSLNQIKLGNKIYKRSNVSEKLFKNIWSAFLIKSISLLNKNGILAFVLPAELLQVKYAMKIKEYVIGKFKRVEIFTFSDLLFECKGQNTIILIGYKKHLNEGVYYSHISSIDEIKTNQVSLNKNDTIQLLDIKWVHHTLDSESLQLLNNIKSALNRVKDYCVSKPGIVTAANNFFIINSEIENQYKWSKYTKPIIQKGSYVQTGIVFDHSDYEELSMAGKPMRIICLSDKDINQLNSKNKEYLLIGEKMKLQNRYKCQIRKNWSVIPNIDEPAEGFFFKRSHFYPKLLKNEANVLVTDAAYKIEMQSGYDIQSFVFSFYNSLTLVFSELGGRYYGGGVLELTPNEFKELPVPYFRITDAEFKQLSHMFEKNKDISQILKYTDFLLLSKIGLSKEKILQIQNLRETLGSKRLKVN